VEHDLFRPAFARRSIDPRQRTTPRLRAGGKPVPIPDRCPGHAFRDHAHCVRTTCRCWIWSARTRTRVLQYGQSTVGSPSILTRRSGEPPGYFAFWNAIRRPHVGFVHRTVKYHSAAAASSSLSMNDLLMVRSLELPAALPASDHDTFRFSADVLPRLVTSSYSTR
jgi:hypothetical protein